VTETHVSVPRPAVGASLLTAALAALASAVGLGVPGLYRDGPVLLPQLYGQDLLTLTVAVPALLVSLYYGTRGSLRGYVGWLGTTGYLLYTYASYAFMTAFNELYLVYVALFGLTLFTLVGGVVRLRAPLVKVAFDDAVGPYVGFQLVAAALVAAMWLVDVVPAMLSGTVPSVLADTGLPTPVIQSLDLAVLVPALAVSASLLRRRRPWGYVFTGVLLVKLATLGLAVLAMAVLQLRAGQPVALPVLLVVGTVSLLGLGLAARFLLALGATPEGASRADPSGAESTNP
jgi:hypothetical protein